uniref:NSP3 n=1 Tax=Rotavirus I TaxID=1637496 RepID=A0A0E3JSL8_9REOV|nr:NSP3 [Rotavirus I]
MAQLVISALSGILSNEQLARVQDVMNDTGVTETLNKYEEAYNGKWFPVGTHFSTKCKIKNLECDMVKLRSMLFDRGINREQRALRDFSIEKNKLGHTILVPKTKLAELMIANTKDPGYKLNAVPCEQFEETLKKLNEAEETISNLKVQLNQCKMDLVTLSEKNMMLKMANNSLKEDVEENDQYTDYLENLVRRLAESQNLEAYYEEDHTGFLNFGADDILEGFRPEIQIDCGDPDEVFFSDDDDFTFGSVDKHLIENLEGKNVSNQEVVI